ARASPDRKRSRADCFDASPGAADRHVDLAGALAFRALAAFHAAGALAAPADIFPRCRCSFGHLVRILVTAHRASFLLVMSGEPPRRALVPAQWARSIAFRRSQSLASSTGFESTGTVRNCSSNPLAP